jgi:hypothetical protein
MKQVLLNASDLNQQLDDSVYYTQVEESFSAKFKTLSLETSIPEDSLRRSRDGPIWLASSLPARTMNKRSII